MRRGIRGQVSFVAVQEVSTRPGALAIAAYGRGLGADEASGFIRALEHGLVVVAPDGGSQVPGARACSKNLHLVGRNEDHVVVHTEVLIHITSYAELVLDYGWEENCLVLDPFVRGAALDLWGFARAAEGPWWEGEFSSSLKQRLEWMVRTDSARCSPLRALSSDPAAEARHNHLAKWREIVTLSRDRDIDLLLVADGARWWYRVSRQGESVLLSAVNEG